MKDLDFPKILPRLTLANKINLNVAIVRGNVHLNFEINLFGPFYLVKAENNKQNNVNTFCKISGSGFSKMSKEKKNCHHLEHFHS